jgi:hypothetical protein
MPPSPRSGLDAQHDSGEDLGVVGWVEMFRLAVLVAFVGVALLIDIRAWSAFFRR